MCENKKVTIYSVDGQTNPVEGITDFELFQVFIFIARQLKEYAILESWQVAIINQVTDSMDMLAGPLGNKAVTEEPENKECSDNVIPFNKKDKKEDI